MFQGFCYFYDMTKNRWWNEPPTEPKPPNKGVHLEFHGTNTVSVFALLTSILSLFLSFTIVGLVLAIAGMLFGSSALDKGHKGVGVASMVICLISFLSFVALYW